MMNDRPVKMADVARESGVSLTTVSLVLRNKPGINKETRQRVHKTANDLGYRLKEYSSAQTNGNLRNIGLIIKSQPGFVPQSNPFYSYVISSIEIFCRQRHINLLLSSMPVNEDNHPVEIPHLVETGNIDGYLLIGAFVDETLDHVFGKSPAPVVLVDAYSVSNIYDAVVSDNYTGAYQAVDYLINHGHRQIALFGSHPQAYPSFSERRRAYHQALLDHGLTDIYVDVTLGSVEAISAALSLLKSKPEVTAIFGINDEMAIHSMRAANMVGKRIPEDISVIGFDDIPLAEQMNPPLTTMQVDKNAMGKMAMLLLSHRIEDPNAGIATVMLKPKLVERGSVKVKV